MTAPDPATRARARRLQLAVVSQAAAAAASHLGEAIADLRLVLGRKHPAVVALCAAQRALDSGRVLVGCAMDVERAAS